MNRDTSIEHLDRNDSPWDILVIGGGATGLGVALDASLRGYKTLLLEQSDFTKGTSSRSTKLLHGGVRYLAQGDINLVLEALRERGLLLKNAPHLTRNQTFVIPTFSLWKAAYYTIGLKLYDLLAGKLTLGKSEWIGAKRVAKILPTVNAKPLRSGVVYHDGQFDDSRLGITLAQSCSDLGAIVLNYVKVTGLGKNAEGNIDTVFATDLETAKPYTLKAKVVVNATGVFVDDIITMDNPVAKPMIRASQGTHIVLSRAFMPTDYALMIPETSDGRVLFAIPWHDKVVVGTTDVLVETAEAEPRARAEEVDFILSTFGRYTSKKPERSDILSVFAGLRPLVRPPKEGQKTKEISRSHKLFVSPSKLITITGGKWTTYRKMAEETVDMAIIEGKLEPKSCQTEQYKLHGYLEKPDRADRLNVYGSDAGTIKDLIKNNAYLAEKIISAYPFTKAEIVWSVRKEMARTVEDILARRLRILFLDAKAAIEMAPAVAKIMAEEMGRDTKWAENQIKDFQEVANHYLLS